MSNICEMDHTALKMRVLELEDLARECGELIWNVDFYHLPSHEHISQEAQSLGLRINETLK